jgi:hypothetical protein
MTSLRTLGAVALSFYLAAPVWAAPPAAARDDAALRVDGVSAPPSVDARTRATLRDAVRERLSGLDRTSSSGEYSVSVSLVQLRRYVGPDGHEPRVVCIVDLALRDARDVLVGSVRGRATTDGTRFAPSLDAAARSAVARVPDLLHAAEARSQNEAEVASARR